MNLSPFTLMILLGLVYVVLGCLLDGFSIVVMTLPIALPMVVAAGFDPIWFGIYLILMVEVSQITPPVGFNLLLSRAFPAIRSCALPGMPCHFSFSCC